MAESQYLPGNPSGQEKSTAIDIEIVVGSILFGGVVLSSVLLASGLFWHWITSGRLEFDYAIAGMNFWEFLANDIRQLFDGLKPRPLVDLGLAILLLTPYARVMASLVYFVFFERNWKYSLFTAFVFAVLTYSLFQTR